MRPLPGVTTELRLHESTYLLPCPSALAALSASQQGHHLEVCDACMRHANAQAAKKEAKEKADDKSEIKSIKSDKEKDKDKKKGHKDKEAKARTPGSLAHLRCGR